MVSDQKNQPVVELGSCIRARKNSGEFWRILLNPMLDHMQTLFCSLERVFCVLAENIPFRVIGLLESYKEMQGSIDVSRNVLSNFEHLPSVHAVHFSLHK